MKERLKQRERTKENDKRTKDFSTNNNATIRIEYRKKIESGTGGGGWGREERYRDRQRQTDRQTQIDRQTDTETETDTERQK